MRQARHQRGSIMAHAAPPGAEAQYQHTSPEEGQDYNDCKGNRKIGLQLKQKPKRMSIYILAALPYQ